MVLNVGLKTNTKSASSVDASKKSTASFSKSSVQRNDVDSSKNRKSSLDKKKTRSRSKTLEGIDINAANTSLTERPVSADALNSNVNEVKSGSGNLDKGTLESGQAVEEDVDGQGKKEDSGSESRKRVSDNQKRALVYENPDETFIKLTKDGNTGKGPRPRVLTGKKPSEIPKLKQLTKSNGKNQTKAKDSTSQPPTTAIVSKYANKTVEKVTEQGYITDKKMKKEMKIEEKIKHSLKENFSALVPLYEKELKAIVDTWVNTIYCSLTMRHNLVKLLYQAMPHINKSQFHMENETLFYSIISAKNRTKTEADNLMQFIKLLIRNRDKTKEDYVAMMENKLIAESYNNNWRGLTKKIIDLEEETKLLNIEVAELIKKREAYEATSKEKIRKMESTITQKDEEVKKLENQLSMIKQREQCFKGNISLKIEEYRDIKEEVQTLKSIENEFEELKLKYHTQNNIYAKEIEDLQKILEDRRKTLQKEKDMKSQLQSFLAQLRAHQQHLYRTIGKDQVDFVTGKQTGSSKMREQLWLSATKLVLKGFVLQTKKLERDKNKMLLELNSNDLNNYNNIATSIMQKDHFIKSIKQQMNAFNTAKYTTAKTSDTSVMECLKK